MSVCRSFKLLAYFNFSRLQGDTVVTYAEATANNVNHVTCLRVYGVCIGAVLGSRNEHIKEVYVFREVGMHLP